jgi:acetyl esterase/lipase
VSVVVLTDHGAPKAETWRGVHDGVLFLAGSEESEKGLLRFPRALEDKGEGELRFLSHVEERYNASLDGLQGMEICNRHTDAKLDRSIEKFLTVISPKSKEWNDFAQNFKRYPDEVFAAGTDYRAEIFAAWDRATKTKHFTGIGANDAHQNQVFGGITFDPYEVSFRNLSTHILANELTESDIRQALIDGHVYVSHDWLCDPTGFAFAAQNNMGVFPMGDPALMWGTTRLIAFTPLAADLKLFRNGSVVFQTNGTNLTFTTKDAGVYRLEAWLKVAGEERPWIYSNPVYLEKPSLSSIPIPSVDLNAPIQISKDIVYTEGAPADEHKHQLDIYAPKVATNAPVFIFFHGGAWKNGDRAQYAALGYRFAGQGVVTLIPSYRLAPQNKHPAQVEDAAAAFAWAMRNVKQYGGDTNRIFIGGHSAGGHMAALLTVDDRYLQKQGFSPIQIAGTVTLSGVFDLSVADTVAASVFSTNNVERKDASPLHHVTKSKSLPPFLITYCQWDYVPLAGQARQFYHALQVANARAELHFTPQQNHISEVIAMTRPDDLTAQAVLRFIIAPKLGKGHSLSAP